MDPARPPLPTVRNFLFHWAGIQSSKRTSGAITPATRQKAGTSTEAVRAPPRPPAEGIVNWPAGTEVAELMVRPAIFKLVRLSQGRCARAGSAVKPSAAKTARGKR